MPFELRLRQLHAHHRGETFAHVIAGEIFLHVLEQAGLLSVEVDGASQRAAEPAQVRSAIHGVDVVRETEYVFRIPVVVLQRQFHGQKSAIQLAFALKINRLLMQHGFAAIQMPDKLGDTAAVVELAHLHRIHALVGERDGEALIQERQLAQALGQRVVVEFKRGHDGGIRLERDLGSCFLPSLAGLGQRRRRDALLIFLLPGVTVAPDFKLQHFRQRVHAAHAYAVQSARNFVALGIELAAGMQLGHHHFRCRDALFFVHVYRDSTAVIHHGQRIVDMNRDVNGIAEPGQSFVHRVIHHFVYQVMQTVLGNRTDVHRRAQPHRFQAFQHLDTSGIVNFNRSHFFCCHVCCCSVLANLRRSPTFFLNSWLPRILEFLYQIRIGITT